MERWYRLSVAALAAAWLVLPSPVRAEPAAKVQAAAIPAASESPVAPDPAVIGVPIRLRGGARPVRPPVAAPVRSITGGPPMPAPPLMAVIPAAPVPDRAALPRPPTMPPSRRLATPATPAPIHDAPIHDATGTEILVVVPVGRWEPGRLADHTACVGGQDVLLGRRVFGNSVIVARDSRAAAVERGLCQAILVTTEDEAQAARRQFAGMGITAEIHRPDP